MTLQDQSEAAGGDPFGGRTPTSHERMTGAPWDASYREGSAPWDIGRPQPAFARLLAVGEIAGPVLDTGCGTGEHALQVATSGTEVMGVDIAETALAMARVKARERGLKVEFAAADALHLERLERRFRTVLDCGLFHTFDADQRSEYVASLASVTEPGGWLYVLCFSDRGPDTGPHPVHEEDLRQSFTVASGWAIDTIEADRIHTCNHENDAPAWLVRVRRI